MTRNRNQGRGGDWIDKWLDDEGPDQTRQKFHSRGHKKKQMKEGEAQWLEPSEANATVTEVFPSLCRVRRDGDGVSLLCPYRRADVYHGAVEGLKERTPVAVGDRVKVSWSEGSKADGRVEGVAKRRNQFMRAAPGRDPGFVHVIAANLDLLVIVAAVEEPHFSPGVVDRFLISAQTAGIPVVLCVNKNDLTVQSAAELEGHLEVYRVLGVETRLVSAKKGNGIADLRKRLTGLSVAFCGHSGVGKTSLLKALLEREVGKIGDVSDVTGKGRHTTTSAVIHEGPETEAGPSRWIDTPGVRSFGLVGLEPEGLVAFFPDLHGERCAVQGCLHEGEDGCAAAGQPRFASYIRILESLKQGQG